MRATVSDAQQVSRIVFYCGMWAIKSNSSAYMRVLKLPKGVCSQQVKYGVFNDHFSYYKQQNKCWIVLKYVYFYHVYDNNILIIHVGLCYELDWELYSNKKMTFNSIA